MSRLIRLLPILPFTALASLQAEPVTFDTAGELAGRFSVTGTALEQAAAGGIDNSGGVAFSAADVNGFATLQDRSFDTADLQAGFQIRQLVFFKTGTRTSFERDNRRGLSIGLTAAPSVTYEANELLVEGAAYCSLYVTDAVAPDGTITAKLSFTTSNPDEYKMLTSTAWSLQTDSWYALEAVYSFPQSFDTLTVVMRLHSASASGELVDELGGASSATTQVPALFGPGAVLRGFFGTRSAERTNVALVDNAELLGVTYNPPPPPIDEPWRSALYPDDWTPPEERSLTYAADMMIQDFSHAGYHRGERAIPDVTGPVFNVIDYGADPSGGADSTAAIQAAIDAASAEGAGVVLLPAGVYKVSPRQNAAQALLIQQSRIVLRGEGADKTFIWNTATAMRNTAIIRIAGNLVAGWNLPAFGSPKVAITQDIPGPSRSVQVTSVSGFKVGDYVIIDTTLTSDWYTEHNVPEWIGSSYATQYLRQVQAIDTSANTLHFHTPLRYAVKLREFPQVYKVFPQVQESGIEDLSIGNTQHPGTGFGDNDYPIVGTAAYDCHNSFAIKLSNTINCWVRNVATFAPAGNAADHHVLSNGIAVDESLNVSLENCDILYPQYGGGGGNGYLYRISANETLLKHCSARFGRHNFVISGFSTSGNVFYRCFSEFTGYPGSARASDTHIHMAQSNLWDNVHVKKDYLESKYRPVDTSSGGFGTVFGVTQTHGVYWNTYGEEYLPGYPYIVRSDQYNFGYVIGTQGPANQVTTLSEDAARTAPVDFLEGIGAGEFLAPASLYDDQFERRRLRDNFTPFYATPARDGLKDVDWLGWLSDAAFPWVYHFDFGWVHVTAPALADFYFYIPADGFLYTSPASYPFFYRLADGAWLYFQEPAGGANRRFYNVSTGSWEP